MSIRKVVNYTKASFYPYCIIVLCIVCTVSVFTLYSKRQKTVENGSRVIYNKLSDEEKIIVENNIKEIVEDQKAIANQKTIGNETNREFNTNKYGFGKSSNSANEFSKSYSQFSIDFLDKIINPNTSSEIYHNQTENNENRNINDVTTPKNNLPFDKLNASEIMGQIPLMQNNTSFKRVIKVGSVEELNQLILALENGDNPRLKVIASELKKQRFQDGDFKTMTVKLLH